MRMILLWHASVLAVLGQNACEHEHVFKGPGYGTAASAPKSSVLIAENHAATPLHSAGAVRIMNAAPGTEDVHTAAAMWNMYLPTTKRVDVSARLGVFKDPDILGFATCTGISPDRFCNLTVSQAAEIKVDVWVHEVGHALIPWQHDEHRPKYQSREIDTNGHWNPAEPHEIMSAFISSTPFLAEYSVLAAASTTAGGSGVHHMCNSDCTCTTSSFTNIPSVCKEAPYWQGHPTNMQRHECGTWCVVSVFWLLLLLCVLCGVAVYLGGQQFQGQSDLDSLLLM